jgi:retron-type reverse transcriptase
MENGLAGPTEEGTRWGGPLSPLLSNIVLDEFDQELDQAQAEVRALEAVEARFGAVC